MAAAARNGTPRRSLVDAAAETLRRRIAEGDFGPSERLPPERVLTDELGVSRTVLREALSSLEALGLVEARGAAGRFVAAGDPARSQSMVAAWLHQHARELLESAAAYDDKHGWIPLQPVHASGACVHYECVLPCDHSVFVCEVYASWS